MLQRLSLLSILSNRLSTSTVRYATLARAVDVFGLIRIPPQLEKMEESEHTFFACQGRKVLPMS